MKELWLKLVFVVISAVVFSACLPETQYAITYPVNGDSYVGTESSPPPVNNGEDTLANEFVITYDSAVTSSVDIVLNGHRISDTFVFGPNEARADISKFEQFLRDGKNTLSVDALGFGPFVQFYYDGQGPNIIITRGEMAVDGNSVEIEGFLRDSSGGENLELTLDQILGYEANGQLQRNESGVVDIEVNPDGSFCACGAGAIDITGLIVAEDPGPKRSLVYSFVSTDIHGYTSSTEYLADSEYTETLAVDNAVRVAIGDTFVQSLKPLLASAINDTLSAAPLDVRGDTWNDPNICNGKRGVLPGMDKTQAEVDEGEVASTCVETVEPSGDGSVFPPGLNPVAVPLTIGFISLDLTANVNQFYMHDGSSLTVGGNNITGRQGTILLNDFVIKENDLLDLDLVLTELIADLTIDAGILGDIDIKMYIERIVVDSDALVSAQNKKVNVQLQDSNFSLQGMALDEISLGGLDLSVFTGLINAILDLLTGLVADLLPGILNPILEENLQKIVIGGTVSQPENSTEFNMFLNVAELGTGNILGPSSPFDMLVGLESVADVTVADDFVVPSLGPVFFDDPINPTQIFNSLGDTGTNITVAINSNLINQSLNAIYGTGISHFTMYDGKLYYGANANYPVDDVDPNTTIASKNDTRIRLWPDMPPAMTFTEAQDGEGAGRAAITYESATLYFDQLKDNSGTLEWQTQVSLKVDFNLAVEINEVDGVFTMGSAGPPVFNVNNVINNTNIQIAPALIQGVLDAALFFGGDILADRFIVLDLGQLVESTYNGTTVKFLSDKDEYTIDLGANPEACISYAEGGVVDTPLVAGVTAGGDGQYDIVCEVVEFTVSTSTVGVTGNQGTNLFFQMEVRDPDIPPAPAIPRFDLDDDGIVDYKDNCSPGLAYVSQAIEDLGGLAGNIDENGDPIGSFEDDLRAAVEAVYASSSVKGYATPTTEDIDNYNILRVGDPALSSGDLGSSPWSRLLHYNPNQYNSDGDTLGELCEDDSDFDGIYTSNGDPVDNCPSNYNPGQEDTQFPIGVGDACNVRSTFVLLRSLESQIDTGGTPYCLTHAGMDRSNWVSQTMHSMVACDPDDVNQRWYMKAVNPNDLLAGVEFYDAETRDKNSDSRLVAYGRAISDGQAAADANNYYRVDEVRLVTATDSRINQENDDFSACGWGALSCNREWDRADPIWYPRAAAASNDIDEASHPWYIDSNFNFNFSPTLTNNGASCLTYSSGWGVDIGSNGDGEYCNTGYRWRWAIWVSGSNAPWTGVW